MTIAPLAALAQQPTVASTGVLTPKQAEQFIRVAQRLYAQADYKSAVGFYQRALAVEPGNIEGISGMGDAMVAAGRPLDATILYNQLLNLRPKDVRGPLGLARAYNRAAQPERALEWLTLAAQKGAIGLTPTVEKGLAYDLLGRPKEAQQVYTEGMKQSPNSIDLLQKLAISLALTEEYPAALHLLQKISSEPGGTELVRETLANIYALSGQPDQAVKILISATTKAEDAALKLPYYMALSKLDLVAKARAVHLGIISADVAANLSAKPQEDPAAFGGSAPPPPAGAPAGAVVDVPAPPLPAKPVVAMIEKPRKLGKPQMIALPDDPADVTALKTAGDPAAGASSPGIGSVGVGVGVGSGLANPVVRASPVSAGDHVWVQLGLSPSRGKLEQQWQWAFAKSQGGLNGLAPYVQPTVVNGKTMLRLLVGGYADGSTASALIKRLHSLKIPGFVNKNVLGADPLYP